MESQNYLLSFCAGVQEGLLQAYHEQCRSTVIVKTRPIKDIVLYILRDDAVFTSSETQDEALVRFTFYLEVESFILHQLEKPRDFLRYFVMDGSLILDARMEIGSLWITRTKGQERMYTIGAVCC